MLGAAAAETMGNIVRCAKLLINYVKFDEKRNPFEVVKQQMQVGWNTTFLSTARDIANLGGVKGRVFRFFFEGRLYDLQGFYAGYFSLILREIPFSCIQFPIYEYMKKKAFQKHKTIDVWNSAWNGFVSASIGSPFIYTKFSILIPKND